MRNQPSPPVYIYGHTAALDIITAALPPGAHLVAPSRMWRCARSARQSIKVRDALPRCRAWLALAVPDRHILARIAVPGVFRSRVNEPPICGVGQRTVAQEVDLPCHARDGLDLAQARADCGRRHIGEREQSHVGRHMSAQAACAFVALSQMANPQPKLARSGAAERGETLRQPRVKIVGELGPEFAVRGTGVGSALVGRRSPYPRRVVRIERRLARGTEREQSVAPAVLAPGFGEE